MPKRLLVSAIALIAVATPSPILRAQTATPTQSGEVKPEKWNSVVPLNKAAYAGKKSAPAPRRDLSGVWDATAEGGIQNKGVFEHPAMRANDLREGVDPDERNIAHPLPYTPLGEETLKTHKPASGVRSVPAGFTNDPTDICDPVGYPRMQLFEMRAFEIVQTAKQVIYLNQYNDNWRVIWTDGRALPKPEDVEPRWNGYSVGKWVDDYTFVVETVGMDERTWLDYAGRPHSGDMRVEERLHRVDHDNLELTLTIDDPKMYTQPWMALNKFPLHLQSADFDMREMLCSPSAEAEYNKFIGDPVSTGGADK